MRANDRPYASVLRVALVATFGCCILFAGVLAQPHGIAADIEPSKDSRDDKKSKSEPRKPAPKTPRNSVDDALLDDLDNELLDGAGELKGRGPAKPSPKPADAPPAADRSKPGTDALIDGEDVGMPSEDEDPLARISQEMRTAEELIPKQSGRAHAEELQRRIVDDLVRLIDQAEAQRAAQQAAAQKKKQSSSAKRQTVKQSKPGSASSKQNSNKPAQDSTNRLGKADEARPDPELMKGLMKDSWGNLPPRAREQMLQNSPERFLPQYELMIERYYQRLAEESSSK